MADTRQVVSWALERKCAFRSGDQWFLPARTCTQLADLRTVASAEGDGRIVNGICVTSWTTERDNSGNVHNIPCSGFRIEERLGPVGGLGGGAGDVPGLRGERQDGTRHRRGRVLRASRHLARFRGTRPAALGHHRAAQPGTAAPGGVPGDDAALVRVLDQLAPPAGAGRVPARTAGRRLRPRRPAGQGRAALPERSGGRSPLGVAGPRLAGPARPHRLRHGTPSSRTAPGARPTPPWAAGRRVTRTKPHECRVCGHTFNPDEHHSSERDEYDWDADRLEKQLGEAGYEQFVRAFLLHRGCSPEQVDEVIDNKNNGPLLRRIKAVRQRREPPRSGD